MSEKGSFVTEYTCCDRCIDAVKQVMVHYVGEDNVMTLHGRIVAGKISGMYENEELNVFEWEIQEEMAAKVCHPVRVAVLAESGEHKIFTVQPKERSNGDT